MYNIEEIKNTIICGDCLEEMKKIPDNSIDSIVTDPPAGINFMGKTWDTFDKKMFGRKGNEGKNDLKVKKNFNILPRYTNTNLFAFQDFIYQVFSEAIRILKPGGHALVWALPRTSHHTAMGIERAGFEIRDKIYFVFGSGFPKSLNIGKAVDKLQGNKRETVGTKRSGIADGPFGSPEESRKHIFITKGNSPYEGWGTALKPAVEEWILARKPISEKNIAKNVLKWGTGGLNIDGCRVEAIGFNGDKTGIYGSGKTNMPINYTPTGRFPSHLILNGSEEVEECFPDSKSGNGKANIYKKYGGHWGKGKQIRNEDYGDSGSASRFFYKANWTKEELAEIEKNTSKELQEKWIEIAKLYDDIDLEPIESFIASLLYKPERKRIFYGSKASKKERDMGLEEFEIVEVRGGGGRVKNGYNDNDPEQKRLKNAAREFGAIKTAKHNIHPTVKPLSLMRYLCRLITPPKGIVLDMFAGSGSTLIAAKQEGFNYIGIERESDYVKIAEARLKAVNNSLNI